MTNRKTDRNTDSNTSIPGSWSFWCRGDADHVRISDGHHAKGYILAASVVGTPHLDTDTYIDRYTLIKIDSVGVTENIC